MDNQDHIYVCGETWSDTYFPVMAKTGAYNQLAISCGVICIDAFVVEYVLGGTGGGTQVWGTYFGGDEEEAFLDIDITSNNGIVLVGRTYSSVKASSNPGHIPCTVPTNSDWFPDCDPGGGAYVQDHNLGLGTTGALDDMIVEFNSSGALVWSTYFGGSKHEAFSPTISVSPYDSDVFAIGVITLSPDFPVTGGGYQQPVVLGGSPKAYGGVAKFDQRNLTWSTGYGADGCNTYTYDVKIGKCDFVYLTGRTSCDIPAGSGNHCAPPTNTTEFPICKRFGMFFQEDAGGNPIHYGANGASDGFLAIFDNSNDLIYSGWLGAEGDDYIFAVASDLANTTADRVYLGGGLIGSTQLRL